MNERNSFYSTGSIILFGIIFFLLLVLKKNIIKCFSLLFDLCDSVSSAYSGFLEREKEKRVENLITFFYYLKKIRIPTFIPSK